MSLHFDVTLGDVHLPSGLLVSPLLTRTQLINSCALKGISLHPYSLNSAPFRWFSVDGGFVGDEPLGAEFRFWGELLVNADLHLDRGGESLDFVGTKKRHDVLLESQLGEPNELWDERLYSENTSRLFPVYRYPWGKITSLQDGHVFIRVEYAGRRKAAEAKFQRINVPDQLSVVERFRKRPR